MILDHIHSTKYSSILFSQFLMDLKICILIVFKSYSHNISKKIKSSFLVTFFILDIASGTVQLNKEF